jgi:ketosteroid isomerase-like protein
MTSSTNNEALVEANKATVRGMFEQLNAGNVAGFTGALAPNYVRHCQAMPAELQEIRGKDAMSQWLLANQTTFPDYREEIEWLVGGVTLLRGDQGGWARKAGR